LQFSRDVPAIGTATEHSAVNSHTNVDSAPFNPDFGHQEEAGWTPVWTSQLQQNLDFLTL